MTASAMQILLVDDDEVDAMMVRRAIDKAKLDVPIHVVRDGIDALAALRGKAPEMADERPCVVLLDLNMPRMDGHEFLKELRSDPDLNETVVFVLSSSSDLQDIQRAYERHVAGYMEKSSSAGTLQALTQILDGYRESVHLPPRLPRDRSA